MEEVEEVFKRLRDEVGTISYKWRLYKDLYGVDSVGLLNKTSKLVFSELQSLLFENIMLSISKLYDGESVAGNKNLSLKYLVRLVKNSVDPLLAREIEGSIIELEVLDGKLRVARNKRIAHFDLDFALGRSVHKVQKVVMGDIDEFLGATYNIMNKVDGRLFANTTLYEDVILPFDSGVAELLRWLKKGVAYDRLEKQGVIENGAWRHEGGV